MPMNRKLLVFLDKICSRHLSEYGPVARGLRAAAEGKELDFSYASFPDEKMKFAAHVLCTLGQETAEDTASMLAKACTAAIDLAEDKDNELALLLVEALEALSMPEPDAQVTPAAPTTPVAPEIPEVTDAEVESIKDGFNKSAVVVTKHGGKDLYTFTGHRVWPAELENSSGKYRLINGSYKKGIYQKV